MNLIYETIKSVNQIVCDHCQSLTMFCHGDISSAPMKDYVSSSFYWSKPLAGCITTIFVIGFEYSPEGVFTFTFLTVPSCPGYTSTILPMIHSPLTVFGSATITKSSTRMVRLLVFHFLRGTNNGNTSPVQKKSTILLTNLTLLLGFLVMFKKRAGVFYQV